MAILKSKTLKNVLKAFMWIIIGLSCIAAVIMLRIFNQRTPILVGYFSTATETLLRAGYIFIIYGLLILINTKKFFSKLFSESENDLDFEKFKQDEFYTLKTSIYRIQRDNRKIVIQRSDKNLLMESTGLVIIILALLYLFEPTIILVLTNLNLNSPIYKDSNAVILIFLAFYFLVVDYILVRLLIKFVKMLVHRYQIIIDAVSKQITFKRYYINPLNIFWNEIVELTLPIDNIESLKVMFGLYSTINLDINDFHRYQKHEYPVLTISSDNWKGDEKLFQILRSKRLDNRIKILSDSDMDILYEIKHFLVDYVPKGYQ